MKRYVTGKLFGSRESLTALDGVSLSIQTATTLALVGESGSGKSTLALCVACLERPTSGSMWFDGRDVAALGEKQQRAVRPQIQLVFQDPANSLNSRLTALEIVAEPLIIQRRFDKQTRSKRACALLERVGISAKKAGSRPDEFSCGTRQRLSTMWAVAL